MGHLQTQRPVDCCSVIYDPVLAGGGLLDGHGAAFWLWPMAVGAALLILAGLRAAHRSRAGLPFALLSALWVIIAGGALVQVLSAYHYEILGHRCPWCLFLSQHGRVGYPLFAALAVVLLEGGATWIASRVAQERPQLEVVAQRRARRGSLSVVLAVLVYLGLAVGPALIWRLSRGVWM